MADNIIPVQEIPQYTRKDFTSDQTVRWCPGCGDYAILAEVQKVLPDIGKRKEDIVFISGIGCSSRFPYYMNTYGIHSIHGRAPTLATGLKIANPELSVWVVTGDGDGLSIGGNHLLHACRRNVDINILLFNNRIYGLTKGQYSPTSLPGTKTKSSPMGSLEQSFNPLAIALGAEATFIARSWDTGTNHLKDVMYQAAMHKGSSFVEILQNCIIFNDKTWDQFTDRQQQADTVLFLEHGKPMIFGKNKDKGIRLNGLRLEVVELGNGISEADLLVHDETNDNLAYLLSQLETPMPMGVIYRASDKQPYEVGVMDQVHRAQSQKGTGDLKKLYEADYLWTVAKGEETTAIIKEGNGLISEMDEEYADEIAKRMTGEWEPVNEVHEGLQTDPIANLLNKGRALITVKADASLDTAVRTMQEQSIGALVVVDDSNRPIGIFTELDVLRKVATQIENMSAHKIVDFMTRNPDTLTATAPIAHAVNLMAFKHYRHVPVVDSSGTLQGIISFRDVVHYIAHYFRNGH
jgi:2-oxoglutarate ferredoxin oxidoreductase subunit beta